VTVKVATRVPVLPSVTVTSLIVMDGGGGTAFADKGEDRAFFIRSVQFIEPGVYRLQKSWEQTAVDASLPAGQCVGLLTELGLAVVQENKVLTSTDLKQAQNNLKRK